VEAGAQVLERAEASDGRPERESVAADGSLSAQFEHTVVVRPLSSLWRVVPR
jgi:methionine aminopeptidase